MQIVEVADEKTPDKASEALENQIKEKEGNRILSHISDSDYVIALAINGKERDSVELAEHIRSLGLHGKSSLAFVIGGIEPEAVTINTFGTGTLSDAALSDLVENVFSFQVADIISQLELRKPQFQRTAAYGHFGRENQGFKWEDTDKAWILKQLSAQ